MSRPRRVVYGIAVIGLAVIGLVTALGGASSRARVKAATTPGSG